MRLLPFILLLLSPATEQDAPVPDEVKVNDAIRRGVEFLKKKADSLKPWNHVKREMRYDELTIWTFVHAGVPEDDPVFKKLFDKMLDSKLDTTYLVSLQAMILEEVDRVTFQPRIAQCAQYLLDNQADNGQWSYGDPSAFADDMPTGDRRRKDVATKSGDGKKSDRPGKRRKPKVRRRIPLKKMRKGPRGGDNSNSQYAALGLRACHDAGIVLPKDVVLKAKRWWEQSQKNDGGWCYGRHSGHEAYGSMSAGALGSLIICKYILGEDRHRNRRVKDGLQWLADNFSVEVNPGTHEHKPDPMHFYYYYMYALERAGLLYGTERIGDHWWYAEGAKVLLDRQNDDGSWKSTTGGNAIWDTCFAILFLRRATRPLEDVATGKPERDP